MNSFAHMPAASVLAAAAAVFGIHLGESAVAEIDPVYFRGPAIHPADRGAAIDPNEDSDSQRARFASLYGWEEGNAVRAADCGDCDAIAARDAYAHAADEPVYDYSDTIELAVAYLEKAEAEWAEAELDEDRWAEETWERRDRSGSVERHEVKRYASYPVTAEEAERLEIVYLDSAGGF